MNRHKILLYNPDAVFYTMPLALTAVGSSLDPDRYDVRILDGRLDAPEKTVLEEIDGAACLGVTVISGAPIRDALKVSRAAKRRRPDLPIIWGGWHPSLFPEQCISESCVDIAVQGQGVSVFPELVERIVENANPGDLPGVCCQGENGVQRNAPEPLKDLNLFPGVRYELMPVRRYFKEKGKLQIDYLSSMGCVQNCAFCADPFVYGRRWTGLDAERVAGELEQLSSIYHMDDVNFQDEAFFTDIHRAEKIAGEFVRRRLKFSWAATLRADQASRISDDIFELFKTSGLRRVMIGVESGHPDTLRRLNKKITIDQVFHAADLSLRHGVGAIFSFIVGFPNESKDSIRATIRLARKLRAMSPKFETPVFYFKPYPGSRLSTELAEAGYEMPDTLDKWADFDFIGSAGPWVPPDLHQRVEAFKFYNYFAWKPSHPIFMPLKTIARWRLRHDAFGFAFERRIWERFEPPGKLS